MGEWARNPTSNAFLREPFTIHDSRFPALKPVVIPVKTGIQK
jgi:hypothetical protein